MLFENKTSFPAMAWYNVDKDGNEYNTVLARVKFRFKEMDKNGVWTLKLDTDQGELFGEDVFYEEDGTAETSSVLYESDFCPFKPKTDIIINANAHASDSKSAKIWLCGLKVIRYIRDEKLNQITPQVLLEKDLIVMGESNWVYEKFLWEKEWVLSQTEETTKVPLRYENAYGGGIINGQFSDNEPVSEENLKFVAFSDENPTGKGLIHKSQLAQENPIENIAAPQILYPEDAENLEKTFDKKSLPKSKRVAGFGAVHRAWLPRRDKIGTADEQWQKNKAPLMPDDFDESYNNAAPEDQQLEKLPRLPFANYKDQVAWMNMSKGGPSIQGFNIPDIFFEAYWYIGDAAHKSLLEIDTVIVDIRDDDMSNNCVYISWRKREKLMPNTSVALNVLLSKSFIYQAKK